VHGHHEIALGMEGLGVNKLKDNNHIVFKKHLREKAKIEREAVKI